MAVTVWRSVDGRVFVSEMPRPWELREIVERFAAVVSLATPSEHAMAGYDPRGLQAAGVEFLWRPVPKYAAYQLGRLARLVQDIRARAERGPVLVHSLRGCGRVVMVAAAYLIVSRGRGFMEALADATGSAGCGVESKAQVMVVRGLAAARHYGVTGVEGLDRRGSMVVEYAGVLGLELSPYVEGVEGAVCEAIRSLGVEGCSGGGEDPGLAELVEALVEELGYTVVDLRVSRGGGSARLVVEVWVERETHPRSARPLEEPPAARRVERAWRGLAGGAGLGEPLFELRVHPASVVPEP